MEGQLDFNFYTSTQKIEPIDLVHFINSLGKSQYEQIGDVITRTCESEGYEMQSESIGRITNAVSVWLLNIGNQYRDYIKTL